MKNIVNFLEEYADFDLNESYSSCGKSSKKDVERDALKAYKKRSREEEIEAYGKPINHNKVFKNKKVYTRKEKHKNK